MWSAASCDPGQQVHYTAEGCRNVKISVTSLAGPSAGQFTPRHGAPTADIAAIVGIHGSANLRFVGCINGSSVTSHGAVCAKVCTASRHCSNGAEVVGVVTGSGVSPMNERVEKYHLIRHAAHMQYLNVVLDNDHLFVLNDTGSSYALISSALVQKLGLRINKRKRTFKVVDSNPKAFVGFLDE